MVRQNHAQFLTYTQIFCYSRSDGLSKIVTRIVVWQRSHKNNQVSDVSQTVGKWVFKISLQTAF